MRPLELRLAHFGPYRDEAILDFEALDRLFLVCGPTGAGKTTLFDALTFALYERTPGTRGGLADQLASHHAPEGSVPRVSLRFALGPQEWRVTRHLRHRVLKQRGEGWRDQDAQVLLEAKKNGAWETVPGKRSEINQRLEDLVGLSAEEFAKIVVLPQGDFQRFLEASSNEREKMLQKLFPVEAYDRLVEGLKAQAKAVEEARKRWEDRWEDLIARGAGTDDLPALEAAVAEADAGSQAAAGEEAAAAEAVVRLKAVWDDWRLLQAKLVEKAQWDSRRPKTEADRERLDRARKARPLGSDLDRQERIVSDGTALRSFQDKNRAELHRIEVDLADKMARADEKTARETRLSTLLGDKGALEQQRLLWKQARILEEGEAGALSAEAEAEGTHRRAIAVRQTAESSLPPAPLGPGWDEALALLDSARTGEAAAQTRAEAEALRRSLEADLTRTAREAASQAIATEAADHEAALWSQLVDAVQSAALAETLVPGAPCPVCGSVDHPRPAAWPEASAEAPRRLEAALKAQATARQNLAVVQARHHDLIDRLSGLPAVQPGPTLDETVQRRTEAQAQVEALQRWTKARDEGQKALDAALTDEAKTREVWQSAVQAREIWTTRRQSLAQSVPADPTPRLEAVVREADDLQRRLDDDLKKNLTLLQSQKALQTRIEETEKQLEAQREEYRVLQTTLEGTVATLGWTLGDLKAARLSDAELKSIEQSLAEFDREAHRLEGETTALEARVPQGEPAPLAPAEEALAAVRRRRETADALAREKAFALRDRERIEAELREASVGKQALEADFQRLVPLAQALDGRNRLNLKLTTWVLIQALEQVARSATHRLASMSGGRYALKVQSQGLDGRKDWGLDLSVVDGYTGQERAVGTLSGGEKFMTSISLALGLADVIQERAGGLKLEAIFIDEGFGTLDDQSLDRAMAILHDLGQQRSVGIISHVAELRQRISSRVEVVKGKNGSTLKMG